MTIKVLEKVCPKQDDDFFIAVVTANMEQTKNNFLISHQADPFNYSKVNLERIIESIEQL